MSTYLDSAEQSAGGKKLNRVLVHQFKIGDVDEPDIIANIILSDWLEKDRIGQWIWRNHIPLQTCTVSSELDFFPMIKVYADLEEIQLTEYYLIK